MIRFVCVCSRVKTRADIPWLWQFRDAKPHVNIRCSMRSYQFNAHSFPLAVYIFKSVFWSKLVHNKVQWIMAASFWTVLFLLVPVGIGLGVRMNRDGEFKLFIKGTVSHPMCYGLFWKTMKSPFVEPFSYSEPTVSGQTQPTIEWLSFALNLTYQKSSFERLFPELSQVSTMPSLSISQMSAQASSRQPEGICMGICIPIHFSHVARYSKDLCNQFV